MNWKIAFLLLAAAPAARAEVETLAARMQPEVEKRIASRAGHAAFEGATWKLTDRFCAPGPTEADMANPTRVYDISVYHQTWTFENGKQSFLIHNAAFDMNKCATRIDGAYGFAEVSGSPTVDGVLGTTTERRRRVDCPNTYPGPALGLLHVLKWESANRDAYRVVTLAGSISATACPSLTDYLVTRWKKYPDLPLQ